LIPNAHGSGRARLGPSRVLRCAWPNGICGRVGEP